MKKVNALVNRQFINNYKAPLSYKICIKLIVVLQQMYTNYQTNLFVYHLEKKNK